MNRFVQIIVIACCLAVLPLYGQQFGTLSGTIVDDKNNPVENFFISTNEKETNTLSTHNGYYELKIPAGKDVEVFFQHISYKDTIVTVHLKNNEKVKMNFVLSLSGEQLPTFDVKAKFDDGYVRIDPDLSFKIPTPSGGVESLIKMMPGAFSSNELSNQYNVRGGNYDENLVYVNDIEIYRPFLVRSGQQEGLSFVNMDLTSGVKFSSGGFEPKYGDKMSSVLDVDYKKPNHFGGSVSASLLGATAHVEGNVKNVFSYLVGIRYKSNAYILNSLETKGDYKPRFFDAQMLFVWNPLKKLEISLLGNFAKNQYLFTPSERKTKFGSFSDMKSLIVYFDGQEVDQYENYLGGLTFTYKPNLSNNYKLIISSYYAKESETYDIQGQYWLSDIEPDLSGESEDMANVVSVRGVGTYLNHARNYISAVVSAADLRGEHRLPRNVLSWGIKAQNEIINDQIKEWALVDSSGYTLPNIYTTPGEDVPLNDPSRILYFGENAYLNANNDLNTFRFTGFIQDTWKIDGDSATRFILNGGVRLNYWTFNNELLVSPRVNLLFKPRWKQNWIFFLKTGIYYQPPFYREMRNAKGELNSDIKAQRSYQVVLASEYNFLIWRRPFKLTGEAYYKYMDRLISYTVDNVKIIYSGKNDAVGYATGIDMKLSGEFIPGLESWISLSLMKTEEDILDDYYYDDDGNKIEPGYIPRPSDQSFTINLFFQDNIPSYPPVRVHLNFVFASGLPYGAPGAERYKIVYTDKNGDKQVTRMPWYRRVDIGFSYMFLEQSRDRMKHKTKFFRAIKNAGLYFEVFNLLGINNVSSYMWVSDTDNNLFPVPNYLTQRLINLKLAVEF